MAKCYAVDMKRQDGFEIIWCLIQLIQLIDKVKHTKNELCTKNKDERDVDLSETVRHKDSEYFMEKMLWRGHEVPGWFRNYVSGMYLESCADFETSITDGA
ncbi:unnamed protein product [Callosobruchus maculatus]|uniref:Uncharacterized protein n=1 Tax=Callosobruchus maculatus TaxID=64391 RepID=A0A653BMG9_CALMS|nr:unnamed protein product [Callosobruchus maculatus]